MWWRSVKTYLLMLGFFCSLAAVYMNHYVDHIKPFYFWSMVDAAMLFPLIGIVNGFVYPWFFREVHTEAET